MQLAEQSATETWTKSPRGRTALGRTAPYANLAVAALLVLGASLGASSAGSEPPAQLIRTLPFGDRLLPVFQPPWLPGTALETLRVWLDEEPIRGADALQRVTLELSGCLLGVDPAEPNEPWLRAGDPAETFRQFVGRDPVIRLAYELHGDEPVASESPLFWHPDERATAARAFDFAVEEKHLLNTLRLQASPNFPRHVSRELRGWLSDAGSMNAGTRFRSTFPTPLLASPEPLPEFLRLDLQVSLDPPRGSETDLIHAPDAGRIEGRADLRRLPLAEFYPLVADDLFVVSIGSRIMAISNGPQPRVVWQSSAGQFGATLYQVHAAAAGGEYLALVVRRPTSQSPPVVMTSLGAGGLKEGLDTLSFNRVELLQREADDSLGFEVVSGELADALEEATAGATVSAPPLFADDCLYLLLSRGWSQVRLEVVAIDLVDAEVRWRRQLGATEPMLSLGVYDFRGVLRTGQLVPVGSDLLVAHDAGWLARVDRSTGAYRGILGYPRYKMQDHVHESSSFSTNGVQFQTLAAWRSRYLGPVVYRSTATRDVALGETRVLILPPDSRHLLSVDPFGWRIAWHSSELTATTMLLGVDGDVAVLLDCGTPRGTHELKLRRFDLNTEEELPATTLRLDARFETTREHWWLPTSELLVGVPRLVGSAVWIPTLLGIEAWELSQLDEERHRVVVWPQGAFGGTVVPIPGNRWVAISRGVSELKRPSVLEVLSAGP